MRIKMVCAFILIILMLGNVPISAQAAKPFDTEEVDEYVTTYLE